MCAQVRGNRVGEKLQFPADCTRSAIAYSPALESDQAHPALLQPAQCCAATAPRFGINAVPPIVCGSIEPLAFDNFANLAAHVLVSSFDSRRRRRLHELDHFEHPVRTRGYKFSCVLLDFAISSVPDCQTLAAAGMLPCQFLCFPFLPG